MPTITELKTLINSLSPADKQELVSLLSSSEAAPSDLLSSIQEARFADGLFCPKCGCTTNIVRNGKYKDKQRFLCRNCKSTFTCTKDTILHRTHKPLEIWKTYLECMASGLTIRKIAKICNISVPTAFYWRHKILDGLRSKMDKDSNKLSGVIESDETYFQVSYKGQKKDLPRESKVRGTKATKRGLSDEQVCVVCGVDRQNTSLAKVSNLGKVSANDLNRIYIGRVERESIFCTDSEKSYRKFARDNGFRLIQIERGKHKNGIYHINHINSYHSHLKSFMEKFKGVATKYLDNYLTWNKIKSIPVDSQIRNIASQTLTVRNITIKTRPLLDVSSKN